MTPTEQPLDQSDDWLQQSFPADFWRAVTGGGA